MRVEQIAAGARITVVPLGVTVLLGKVWRRRRLAVISKAYSTTPVIERNSLWRQQLRLREEDVSNEW